MQELFKCRNGTVIMDPGASGKLFRIKQEHPEVGDGTVTPYEWSDMGLAELFGLLYASECRYCPERKDWYTYYDGAWRRDEGEMLVSAKMKEFSRLMSIYCVEIEDDDLRDKYFKFINGMGDRRFRERVVRDARDVVPITAAAFDANPYLINCLNGTYDLRDFSFREHRWDDFLTMQTAFSHTVSKEVKCARWEKFISEICCGDKDKMDYLQRALGYSMLGLAQEECMFVLWGKTTRNGKSTLLNTIESLLGDYAKVAPVGLICHDAKGGKDAEAASPTLAGLKGKRFVTMAESNEYGKLDEEKIKQLTGGEEITARALYENSHTFRPQFTLWLSCNDLPTVSDHSLFASDRLRVIEFTRHFGEDEQDKGLKQELCSASAMPGIFMWLIRGYRKYLDRGLEMSASMKSVVREYEHENDIVGQFLEARCERMEAGVGGVSVRALFDAYKLWARSQGVRVLSGKKFNAEMERHVSWHRGRDGDQDAWIGLKLKEVLG